MFLRTYKRLSLIVSLFVTFSLGAALIPDVLASQAVIPGQQVTSYPIQLVPDQLALRGHVATKENSLDNCPANYFPGTPPGTIVVGVNPTSCDPATWNGGSATAQLDLQDIPIPSILVLEISWTNLPGKGIHSPEKDRVSAIHLDGHVLWDKRTIERGPGGDYYAAKDYPIRTTIVLTRTGMHTLEFSVPPHTAWDISQIELSAHPYPSLIKGLGYSPYRDCQAPGGREQPSIQQMQDDLFRLKHTSTAIRTYAATGANRQVPALANAVGLPVYAGAWIDNEPEKDAEETQSLIELAHTASLAGAIVGNEYYLRNNTLFRNPPDPVKDVQIRQHLVDQIATVKRGIAGTGIPLGTAEIDSLMFSWTGDFTPHLRPEYMQILEQLDFVMVHIYPFWMGRSINGAAAFVVERFKAMQNELARVYPGKRLIIGETGWPSRGQTYGAAVPSPENQRRYMIEFLVLAEQPENGIDYMYFDPFDELWKVEEGPVGQNWGYSYADRTAKHDFIGVLIPGTLLPSPEQSGAAPQFLVQAADRTWKSYLPYIAHGQYEPLIVYDEWPNKSGPFAPSGYMGDQKNVTMFGCNRSDPHGGEMAVRATFIPTGARGWG